MPELPEVETVRRMLAGRVLGLTVTRIWRSRARLHAAAPGGIGRSVPGCVITSVDRRGKYLLVGLDRGLTLLSHLGMSGRWLYFDRPPRPTLPHVHARLEFVGGSGLCFQDPRRFGQLRVLRTDRLDSDRSLAALGPDPVANPPDGARLAAQARGVRVTMKSFLLDQRRIAGIGNIYASEVMHRAGVDPRCRVDRLGRDQWNAIAREIQDVLDEAIERMGTTFSTFRTIWNEPGQYGGQLRVYDRAGQPCRTCGSAIRRIVQGQRVTYFCRSCQSSGPPGSRSRSR